MAFSLSCLEGYITADPVVPNPLHELEEAVESAYRRLVLLRGRELVCALGRRRRVCLDEPEALALLLLRLLYM